ncbi:protein kinase domain-containing protein [Gemmatimonas phototrophica]|uniref:protein kinase domain-containing protein n=1 Tax=Gemmatimonas phototrophica TaxID=1379270 RepID=UPI0009ED8B69|nr:protein kinase [Gemmatimonas phototrophica]
MSQIPERLMAALVDRYRIERELGAGGMATVYLAHDLRHEREVAIKVLHPDLGAALGAERFLAEIKVTAKLQHPHILGLIDSGVADGLLYYVMPFVAGETLRARMQREGQLPVADAVRLASEVAGALDFAHRQGIVHRDIKPENVLLQDGRALVADFGIALAVQSAGGQRMTQTGLSLGTPQYMSPEQATGERIVDARADVYALAVVTYEMLVGEPPFTGPSVQAVVARLLSEQPRALATQRKAVPPHVEAAVMQGLEKLAADRFATAAEFAEALQGKGDTSSGGRYITASAAAPSTRRRWMERAAWITMVGAVGVFAWTRAQPPTPSEAPVLRLPIDAPAGERFMTGGFPIVISPQGDRVAYVTQGTAGYATIVQRLDSLDARVRLAPRALRWYAFSPDGRELVYNEGYDIYRTAATGGTPSLLGGTGGWDIMGLAWMADGTVLIGSYNGLSTIPARGGAVTPLTDSTASQPAFHPVVLPDGKTVIVGTANAAPKGNLVAITLATGAVTELPLPGRVAIGMVDDHLVYLGLGGDITAARFDAASLKVLGDPVTLVGSVGAAGLSPQGTLAYIAGNASSQLVLASGTSRITIRPDSAIHTDPRFSPDGRRLAVVVGGKDGTDIWVLDRAAGTFSRLTTIGVASAPEWSADGRRVIYKALIGGDGRIFSVAVDGSGSTDTLFNSSRDLKGNGEVNEALLSPDGRWLVIRTAPSAGYPRDIYAMDLSGDRTLRPIAVGPSSEIMPRLSRDGKWLAYQSDVSGRAEIYLRPFPGDGPRVQVSDAGGSEPLFDASGRTLYYRGPGGIVAASLTAGPDVRVSARRLALSLQGVADPTHPSYDVTPDGTQFLILQPTSGEARGVLVSNWARELRRRLMEAR